MTARIFKLFGACLVLLLFVSCSYQPDQERRGNAQPQLPRALVPAAEYQVLLDAPGTDLVGWTGDASVASGRFRVQGAAAQLKHAIAFPNDRPYFVTGEAVLAPKTTTNLRLLSGTDTLVQVTIEDLTASLHNAAGKVRNAGTVGKVFRFYLWHNPVSSVGRVWLQDDPTSGPRYLGEFTQVGTADGFEVKHGSENGNILTLSNIIAAPVYALAHGDSRVAGHNAYDPYPGLYQSNDLDSSFPHRVYLNKGAYVINGGRGGASYSFNASRLADLLRFEPKVVVLGTSNMFETLQDQKALIRQMADDAHAAGAAVVLTEFTPVDDQDKLHLREALNTWMSDLARTRGYLLASFYETLSDGGTELADLYDVGDGVHLSARGYQVMGDTISALLP